MTTRTVVHDTIVLERTFSASPARVFAAWSRADVRRLWMAPSDQWEVAELREDFRVSGSGSMRFGPKGNPHLWAETHYLDIVDEQRIVMAGTMFDSNVAISCSLATVELFATGAAVRMIYTEQAAFLDGRDQPRTRRQGWNINLDKLEAYLGGAQ
jgi:uncharacterized protein YndB with AHSA1/START domain